MMTSSTIRMTGITLGCLGAGALVYAGIASQEVFQAIGGKPDTFLDFYFLGQPISSVDLNLHDTYYVVMNPVWSWLAVLGMAVGVAMTVCPNWLILRVYGRRAQR